MSLRGKVLILGSVVLAGLAVGLWKMTRDMAEVDADPAPVTKAPVAAPPEADKPAAPSAARDARIAPVAQTTRPVPRSPAGAPSLDPPVGSDGKPMKPDPETPIRRSMLNQVRKQVDAIDTYVSDCVSKANKSSGKISGVAALTVKVEHLKQKSPITEVGVEPTDTTIKDPALLDCLRDTGKRMQIDLPDEAASMVFIHQVNLDGGAIADHKLTALYMHDAKGELVGQTPAP